MLPLTSHLINLAARGNCLGLKTPPILLNHSPLFKKKVLQRVALQHWHVQVKCPKERWQDQNTVERKYHRTH